VYCIAGASVLATYRRKHSNFHNVIMMTLQTCSVALILDCITWTRKTNTAARNGVFYGWTTESICKAACLSSPSCVAVDLGPFGCVLHNNASDLATAYHAIGVTHFVLRRTCQPTSPPSTESLLISTTTSRTNVTGME